ncbi:MAG: DegV family protein [Candidatus Dormibacteria bacterium]
MERFPAAAASTPPSAGAPEGTAAVPCAVVTGSGALLPPAMASMVTVVELPVRIGDEAVLAGTAAELHAFYDRLRAGAQPDTSTTPPGTFLEAFRKSPAENIICLTMPAGWSGMDGSARLAARMLAAEEGRERVTVVDCATAAAGLGLIARVTALLCARGAAFPEVMERTRSAIRDVRMFGALETLEYVARSGRINSLLAGISDSLHVRPVFRLSNNQTGRVALVRTHSGVLSALEKTAREMPGRLWVLVFHAEAGELAEQLGARLGEACDVVRLEIVALDPIIGTHTGPGVVGYAALPLVAGEMDGDRDELGVPPIPAPAGRRPPSQPPDNA